MIGHSPKGANAFSECADQRIEALPELLAPAGNWECARAAVENGADAIYFGLDRFNARMRADNFRCADLPELMSFLHLRGVRGYVTFNTLVFTGELAEAEQFLIEIIDAGVDAAIVQDVGVCRLIRSISPDFPIHVSTQMSVTSAAGVRFARELEADLVVIARENSLADIQKIRQSLADDGAELPLETFVHGALCVAYSGQCLTSEALGGRSANRGECAQACRMTYQLVVDGEPKDLGHRQYLLSPQDLAGIELIPQLAEAGIRSLKIEGRLKSPEYVAAITRAYRDALDKFAQGQAGDFESSVSGSRYPVEMAFSRGLYSGWLKGIDNQELVHARYGKKRGVYLGTVDRVDRHKVWVRLDEDAHLKPGDGVVFEDTRRPDTESEQGGAVFQVENSGQLTGLRFGIGPKATLDISRIRPGFRLWKTSDPALVKELRSTYSGEKIRYQRPVDFIVQGTLGEPLKVRLIDPWSGFDGEVESSMCLQETKEKGLDASLLEKQLGRLGNTPVQLRNLKFQVDPGLMVPLSELNRLRRELIENLESYRIGSVTWTRHSAPDSFAWRQKSGRPTTATASRELDWTVTIRDPRQLAPVMAAGIRRIYCEFEDPKKYRETVSEFRRLKGQSDSFIYVAPPRIFKPGEEWILKIVESSQPDGVLVRNYDHLEYFHGGLRRMGDFSLNIANPMSAQWFSDRFGLERLTASYDLNIEQLLDLCGGWDTERLEVCIHQRMPMFHMEHCVFCAFLSKGKDYRDCGRPCEKHQVEMVDRVGEKHYLRADAGCRNTLYNSRVQTGAEFFHDLRAAGIRHFRIDFLNESENEIAAVLDAYRQLAERHLTGIGLWQLLKIKSQLGVTRGQMHQPEKGAWR